MGPPHSKGVRVRYQREIPGLGNVGIETGVVSAARVYVNQQLMPRRGGVITLPTPGGGTRTGRLGNSLLEMHPVLKVDDVPYSFAEEPHLAAKVVVFAPLALFMLVVGGALGGLLGILAFFVNRWVLTQLNWSMQLRWVLIVAMIPLCWLVGIGVVQAVASLF